MECSRDARLLFVGLWNFCDDAGRFPFSPKQVKALVMPGDDDISAEDVRLWLVELSTNGLITVYEVDGKEYLEVTGWAHQKIDRPQPAKYPARIVEHSTNEQRTVSTEGRGSDRNGSDSTLTAPAILTEFRSGIAQTYQAAGQLPPDTAYAGVWLAHGRDPKICLAVIRSLVAKKPNLPLKYFDGPIADAHAQPKGEARKTGPPPKKGNVYVNQLRKIHAELSNERPHNVDIEIIAPSAATG